MGFTYSRGRVPVKICDVNTKYASETRQILAIYFDLELSSRRAATHIETFSPIQAQRTPTAGNARVWLPDFNEIGFALVELVRLKAKYLIYASVSHINGPAGQIVCMIN